MYTKKGEKDRRKKGGRILILDYIIGTTNIKIKTVFTFDEL